MAMQTALRRAQAQDEALLKNGTIDINMLSASAPQKTESPIHHIDRANLDCDSSASSQYSNPPVAISRKSEMSPVLAVPATSTSMPLAVANEVLPYDYKGKYLLRKSLRGKRPFVYFGTASGSAPGSNKDHCVF